MIVVLLDLNYTLVENSSKRILYRELVEEEVYRGWLIDALGEAGATVHLTTVRKTALQVRTLSHLARSAGVVARRPSDSTCWGCAVNLPAADRPRVVHDRGCPWLTAQEAGPRLELAGAHFNPDWSTAPDHKRRVLHEAVYPRHGTGPEVRYLALESNPKSRAMYEREGIVALAVDALGGSADAARTLEWWRYAAPRDPSAPPWPRQGQIGGVA